MHSLSEADAFRELSAALAGQSPPDRQSLPTDLHRRIADALRYGTEDDRAGLVRQLLQRERLRRDLGEGELTISVRPSNLQAARVAYERHGFEAIAVGDRLQVTAREWHPAWVAASPRPPDLLACAAGLPVALRRFDESLPADPFFRLALGPKYSSYRSIGQRQAARSAAFLAPGATLVVNLPTGTGKTEVAVAPALHHARNGGTSLMVVPTISLAQDMDRRLKDFVPSVQHSLAYTSDTPEADRSAIRLGVAHGTVPVVVTSPESALGSLRPCLHTAAKSGWLRYLVIDEAHLIQAWGTDFRPEFASLAALRRELLEAAPNEDSRVRTLALSATLAEADLQLLSESYEGPIDLVAANALRPEPDYWIAQAPDEDTRAAWVLDAVAHLPRPLFLYTSWVDDSDDWAVKLGERYGRVARVTGAVPGVERRGVLTGLRGDETTPTTIDIVVATSAFGLGVSFDDVRSVVHACVPETVDRYYQEVGRGGRDGAAAVGLLLWTEADLGKASPLARSIVLGVKKSRDRWQSMEGKAEAVEDDLIVDLTIVPSYSSGRPSELHTSWNIVTLALMKRAHFIDFHSAASVVEESRDDPVWQRRARVRVRNGGLARPEVWSDEWTRLRDAVHKQSADRLDRMKCLLAPGTRLCEQLAAAFDAGDDTAFGTAVHGLRPNLSCGICDACGHEHARPAWPTDPGPVDRRVLNPRLVADDGADGARIVILTDPPRTRQDAAEVRRLFVENELLRGTASFVAARDDVAALALDALALTTMAPLVVSDIDADMPWGLPPIRTAVLAPLDGAPTPAQWFAGPASVPLVILMSTDAPSLERPDRTIAQIPPPRSMLFHEYQESQW